MAKQEKVVTMTEQEVTEVVERSVTMTLTSLGIKHNEPFETQADFQHLRKIRQSHEKVEPKIRTTLLGLGVTGLAYAIWAGIKELLKS